MKKKSLEPADILQARKERYGSDQDLFIAFELTGPEIACCIRMHLGAAQFLLHARSLTDLLHKGSKTLHDFHVKSIEFIEKEPVK